MAHHHGGGNRPDPKAPLVSYLKVQKDHDRRLYTTLSQSASELERKILALQDPRTVSQKVTRDQSLLVLKATYTQLSKIAAAGHLAIQSGRLAAAAAAVQDSYDLEKVVIRAGMSAQQAKSYLTSAKATAQKGIDSAEKLLMGASYRPLSDQVYDTLRIQTGYVDRVVQNGVASGQSAKELAASVRDSIKPTVPGGVSYAALRLGRTEINNAFHATVAQHADTTPWVKGVTWHLSGSHKVPDECNEYDGKTFAPGELPPKPHPQCFCYMTEDVQDADSFLDDFQAGKYDAFLAQHQ